MDSSCIEKLRILITAEKEKYYQAIIAEKKFAYTKSIYLKIKHYQKLISLCMQEILS